MQLEFLQKLSKLKNDCNKIPEEFSCFKTRRNGIFFYLFLPMFFKNYHFEETFPEFLTFLQATHEDIAPCYKYIVLLNDQIMDRVLKESEKEIEMNEEGFAILMFLWSAIKEDGKNEKEINYLIDSTVKVFEWLGRLGEEKEEEKKELIKKDQNNVKGIKYIRSDNGKIICILLLNIFHSLFFYSDEDEKNMRKDERIVKVLLEIVKIHLKSERNLILKGDIKNIILYAMHPFLQGNVTLDLLSNYSHSFPFSHKTLMNILYKIDRIYSDNDYLELKKKDILINKIECLNNYVDILKKIDESNIKKEEERELCIEWNSNFVDNLKDKVSLYLDDIRFGICNYLYLADYSLINNEDKNSIMKMINSLFIHCSDNKHFTEKELKKNKDIEKVKTFNPFMLDKDSRGLFIICLEYFFNSSTYSTQNLYDLIKNSKEDYGAIDICLKELSGEIVDRIKRKQENNIIKKRRGYERETVDDILKDILLSLKSLMEHMDSIKNKESFEKDENKDHHKENPKEIKENCDKILDVVEEEDLGECFVLYLKHTYKGFFEDNKKEECVKLSYLSSYSNDGLLFFFKCT